MTRAGVLRRIESGDITAHKDRGHYRVTRAELDAARAKRRAEMSKALSDDF